MKKLIEDEIKKHYDNTNFTVQNLANNLNISLSYLRDVVHQEFKMSPKKLIETIRLNESVSLLLSDVSIYTISNKVEYSKSRSFRFAFKNRFGISPLRFKEIVKEKSDTEIRIITNKHLWE